MKKLYPTVIFLILSILLISWGSTGHRKISSATTLFLNDEMAQFSHWPAILTDHASDADYRKNDDPDEGAKHYIDIDNYPEFISDGRIPSMLDSVYMVHHPNFVEDNGFLPWATRTTYDSIVNCFLRLDWDKAVLFAADLGHYVADGHMPLHLTRNYNGQFSGNDGIHSRYESTMIGKYSSQINYEGDSISPIENVDEYIFDYIYKNYVYVDSVLLADDFAANLAGDTYSSEYSAALWDKTRSYTISLFRNASLALTELIYNAWIEAGKPSMNASGTNPVVREERTPIQNYPNPFHNETMIRFHLSESSAVEMMVFDASGRQVDMLLNTRLAEGEHSMEWQPDGLASGLYYLQMNLPNHMETITIIYQPNH